MIARGYVDDFRLASSPPFVQLAPFAALAPVNRLPGYKARYPAYDE